MSGVKAVEINHGNSKSGKKDAHMMGEKIGTEKELPFSKNYLNDCRKKSKRVQQEVIARHLYG